MCRPPRLAALAVLAVLVATALPDAAAAAHRLRRGAARAAHPSKPHAAKKHDAPTPPEAAASPAAGAGHADDVEEVEEVESVDPAAAADGGGADKAGAPAAAGKEALTLSATVGHLHAAVVHLPIAWVLLLALVDAAALLAGRAELLAAGLYLGVLACLSFAPAILSGLVRFSQLPQDPETAAPALLHRNMMYVSLAVALGLSGLRILRRNQLAGPARAAYLGLLALLVGLVSWGAHLGGKLVYGDDFLPF